MKIADIKAEKWGNMCCPLLRGSENNSSGDQYVAASLCGLSLCCAKQMSLMVTFPGVYRKLYHPDAFTEVCSLLLLQHWVSLFHLNREIIVKSQMPELTRVDDISLGKRKGKIR